MTYRIRTRDFADLCVPQKRWPSVRLSALQWATLSVCLLFQFLVTASAASEPECDRSCLKAIADGVLKSMPGHGASKLPLASKYYATENLSPMVPSMMSVWSTVTDLGAHDYFLDTVGQQVFMVATVLEGEHHALLYGRIGLRGQRIVDLDLFINRSRGESGFMFDADGPSRLPDPWQLSIPAARLPTRTELLRAGQSMFDPHVESPHADAGCIVVETGRVAHLSAAIQTAVLSQKPDVASAAGTGSGTKPIAVSCEPVAHRPEDPHARVDIVDEVRGVVVGMGLVTGTVSSYLLSTPPESNFLPDDYYLRYQKLRDQQQSNVAPDTQVLTPLQAQAAVSQVYRIYDGRIQGFQRFIHVLPGASGHDSRP